MKQILIVDDYANGRQVLRERLEMQGYACQEVEDGSAALRAIQTKCFDLVITDNEMPVMTGIQLLQYLAERPEDQPPPVLFLTGHPFERIVKCCPGSWSMRCFREALQEPGTHFRNHPNTGTPIEFPPHVRRG